MIKRSHSDAHFGINATFNRYKQLGFPNQKGIRKKIKNMINECHICQRTRTARAIRTNVGEAEWLGEIDSLVGGTIVGIDIMTVEPKRESNYAACIVVTCAATKWIRTAAIKTELAQEVVEQLEQIFLVTNFPRIIISDGGGCFRSRKYQIFCAKYDIHICMLPPHASAYAGWYEASNGGLQNVLKSLIAESPMKDWNMLLQRATHICNSRPYELGDDAFLCPLDLIYNGNNWFNQSPPSNEELLKKAHVAHLAHPNIAGLHANHEKGKLKQKKLMKKYEELWKRKRQNVRRKLIKQGRNKQQDGLEVGKYARVFRPTLNKLEIRWSEPRLIVEKPSAATRIVKKDDGTTSLEYIVNLQAVNKPEA